MVKKVNKAQTTLGESDWSFLDFYDVWPTDYSNASGYVVAVRSGEDGLEFVPSPAGGPVAMTNLTDGPGSYDGAVEGDYLEKSAGNTLQWATPPPPPPPIPTVLEANFTDWMSTYDQEGGKLLKVTDLEDGIETVAGPEDLPAFTWDQATDVPTMGGAPDGLKIVRLNAAGNAVEFVDPQVAVDPSTIALHDLDQMPSFQAGKMLMSQGAVGDGLIYVDPPGVTTFVGLSDTPTNTEMTNNPGYLLAADPLATGVVKLVAAPASQTFTSIGETPNTYAGNYGNLVAVHPTLNELTFISPPQQPVLVAASDETTVLTTGSTKVRFRMPAAMTLATVRASLGTASSSGVVTVDINKNGSTLMATTKLTIDQGEPSSYTAATPPVLTTTNLSEDDEITIDIDTAGSGAAGLKVTLVPV